MVLVKSEEEQFLREAVVMGGFLEEADFPMDLAGEREFQAGGCWEVLPRTLFRNEGLPTPHCRKMALSCHDPLGIASAEENYLIQGPRNC